MGDRVAWSVGKAYRTGFMVFESDGRTPKTGLTLADFTVAISKDAAFVAQAGPGSAAISIIEIDDVNFKGGYVAVVTPPLKGYWFGNLVTNDSSLKPRGATTFDIDVVDAAFPFSEDEPKVTTAFGNAIADFVGRRNSQNLESSSAGADALDIKSIYGMLTLLVHKKLVDRTTGRLKTYRSNGSTQVGQFDTTPTPGAAPITAMTPS